MAKTQTKKTVIICGISFVLCLVMFVSTSLAWFTSTTKVSGNSIKSGKLSYEVTYGDGNDKFNITGGNSVEKTLTIENTGTVKLRYTITFVTTGDNFDDVTVTIGDGSAVSFNGYMNDYMNNKATGILDKEKTASLTIKITATDSTNREITVKVETQYCK